MNQGNITEDDYLMLESLVKSPAFAALKKLTAMYRAQALGTLGTSGDTHLLFQNQGRVISLNAIDNLPLLVAEWKRLKEKERQHNEELEARKARVTPRARKLPPKTNR